MKQVHNVRIVGLSLEVSTEYLVDGTLDPERVVHSNQPYPLLCVCVCMCVCMCV